MPKVITTRTVTYDEAGRVSKEVTTVEEVPDVAPPPRVVYYPVYYPQQPLPNPPYQVWCGQNTNGAGSADV